MRRSRLLPPALALVFVLLAGGLLAAAAPEAAAGPDRKDAALMNGLKTRRLAHVVFEDVSLNGLLKWLRTATGYNLQLRLKPLAKAGIEAEDIRITVTLEDVTVGTLLDLVLSPHELAVVVKGNVIWITTRADALGRPVTRLYAISHITWQKVDFIAPEINLRPSNFTPIEEYEPERPVEDDPLATGDAVAELVQEIVAPGDWDPEGGGSRATDRALVVRCPVALHPQIERALGIIASLK